MTSDKNPEEWDHGATVLTFDDLSGKAPEPEIEKDLSPVEILNFAKICLAWCVIVFLLSGILFGINKDFKDFFEKSSTVIPPIVTMILGFYFGKKS